jgi:hypothetical protein
MGNYVQKRVFMKKNALKGAGLLKSIDGCAFDCRDCQPQPPHNSKPQWRQVG